MTKYIHSGKAEKFTSLVTWKISSLELTQAQDLGPNTNMGHVPWLSEGLELWAKKKLENPKSWYNLYKMKVWTKYHGKLKPASVFFADTLWEPWIRITCMHFLKTTKWDETPSIIKKNQSTQKKGNTRNKMEGPTSKKTKEPPKRANHNVLLVHFL
jgi:hypothetical protein